MTRLPLSLFVGLAAACGFFFLPTPASAQDEAPRRARIVTIGPGVQLKPKYPGADDLGLSPMPIIGFRREGAPLAIEAPDESWGFGLLDDESPFDIGPAINLQSKRQQEDVGAPVGDVPFTIEAGAFAQLMLGDNLRVRVEGRRGVGGHDGWLGDLSADFVARDGSDYLFTIGPRVRWADNRYHDAYFGVAPAVGIAAGIPAFDPGGGIYAYGAAAGLTVMLNERWGLHTYAGYDRLTGDAADSPIVTSFGSRDQFSGGIGISYSFRLGRRD